MSKSCLDYERHERQEKDYWNTVAEIRWYRSALERKFEAYVFYSHSGGKETGVAYRYIFLILERTMYFAAAINLMLIPGCQTIIHSVLHLCSPNCPLLPPNAAKVHVSSSLTRGSVLQNVFLCGILRQGNASSHGRRSAISSSCARPNLICLSATWTNVVHSPTATGRSHMTLHWAISCGRIRREGLEYVALQTFKTWSSMSPPAGLWIVYIKKYYDNLSRYTIYCYFSNCGPRTSPQ
jgi:hypothetical protein